MSDDSHEAGNVRDECKAASVRYLCIATDEAQIAWDELRRLRRNHPHERYDLVLVRHAEPPIHTIRKWAVVHYA